MCNYKDSIPVQVLQYTQKHRSRENIALGQCLILSVAVASITKWGLTVFMFSK
jgi:hypothetical protein